MSVRVATQGGDVRNIVFRKGMTVATALKSARVKKTKTATLTVDGKPATSKTKLKKESVVVATPKIRNG